MNHLNLFDYLPVNPYTEILTPGVVLLHAFACQQAPRLLEELAQIFAQTPLRQRFTSTSHQMSVKMTNCGKVGWVSDSQGYRYSPVEPETGRSWPPLPHLGCQLAIEAAITAGFSGFIPDTCLINCYHPGDKMGLHQDKDEQDMSAPIVSFSMGLPVIFLLGTQQRLEKTRRILLEHGDILVWGGVARLYYHGVLPLQPGYHGLLGTQRMNLTFRTAG